MPQARARQGQKISKNTNYLKPNQGEKKIVTFILGGPNKYYNFSEKQMDKMFAIPIHITHIPYFKQLKLIGAIAV